MSPCPGVHYHSPVKCDNCDKDATVHEVLTTKGKVVEKHLCEQCARQAGMAGAMHVPITQLLSQYLTAQIKGSGGGAPPGGAVAVPPGVCGACGTSYAQFRHTGLLGCPECYRSFESHLGTLLERAQEGAKAHTGKVPANVQVQPAPAQAPRSAAVPGAPTAPSKAAERAKRIQALKKQLAAAIAAEKYEKAAAIRDELARLDLPVPPTPADDKGGAA